MPKKALPVLGETKDGLGLSTIMDGTLAAEFGVDYVHLAVFAIDVDRVRVEMESDEHPDDARFPFGWDVFLTEVFLLGSIWPEDNPKHLEMLDMLVSSIFESSREGPVLGSQLLFAIFDGISRGALPESLLKGFGAWKRKPVNITEELAPLWTEEESLAAALAKACLDATMDPPLAPPTRAALQALSAQG